MKPVVMILLAAVFAASLHGQELPGPARVSLETVVAKGDPKATAAAVARRGGDWFDVVLSAIQDPMTPIEPTKALIAALPDAEKKGVAAVLDAVAAANAPARQAFAATAGGLAVAAKGFGDPRADQKNAAEAATTAADKAKDSGHEWAVARGAIARAIAGFDAGIADQEPALAAAVEKLADLGDRFGAALASAFHAKALADKGDVEKAAAARERARAGFKDAAAIDKAGKGGPTITGILARLDLALAAPLMDDGRDDAALDACARARAFYKTVDPMRDLAASAVEAAIDVDRAAFPAAIEATKPHVAKLRAIADKAVLVRFAVAVATAMRGIGRGPAAVEFLQNAVARANELGAAPLDHARLRAAMGLVYVSTQQHEAGHAALEVVAKLAAEAKGAEPALLPIAKASLLNAALLLQTRRPDEVKKTLARAGAITLGGPTIDRVAAAGAALALASVLIDQGKPKEALPWIKEAAVVAEDLGVRLEDVRTPSTLSANFSGDQVHTRLGTAFASYDAGVDWAGFEPVFLVTERRLIDVLVKSAPDEPGPSDMAERLSESDHQIVKLRRAACGARGPITEDEARKIVGFRRVVMDEAQARAPTFALRRFPRAGSIKRARENYCGPDGVVIGASVAPQGAYAFSFSRDRFMFAAVDVRTGVHAAIESLAALAKDPKSTPAAWVAACGPIWENLITKQMGVLEGKQWIAVCPDPTIDQIPFEALVPPDAKSDNFRTLPYLIQKWGVGRLPASSFAAAPRARREAAWLADPFLYVISSDKAASGVLFGRAFDTRISAESPLSERAGLFKIGEPRPDPTGPDQGAGRRGRILAFGHGVPDAAIAWEPPTPAVICTVDPPSSKDGANLVSRWLIRGVRGVIAPKGPIAAPVADALMIGVLHSFGQEGMNPVDALSAAKRSFLAGQLKSAVPGLTDAHYHPAHWTQMQATLINP